MALNLIIGNKNYSSWSLRPWIAMKVAGIPFEEKIVPLYYRRSDDEIPHDYVRVMKAAIKSVAPQFSTMRMVKEYVNRFYVDALGLKESLASVDK